MSSLSRGKNRNPQNPRTHLYSRRQGPAQGRRRAAPKRRGSYRPPRVPTQPLVKGARRARQNPAAGPGGGGCTCAHPAAWPRVPPGRRGRCGRQFRRSAATQMRRGGLVSPCRRPPPPCQARNQCVGTARRRDNARRRRYDAPSQRRATGLRHPKWPRPQRRSPKPCNTRGWRARRRGHPRDRLRAGHLRFRWLPLS